jgi:hypothetical protein
VHMVRNMKDGAEITNRLLMVVNHEIGQQSNRTNRDQLMTELLVLMPWLPVHELIAQYETARARGDSLHAALAAITHTCVKLGVQRGAAE